MDPSCVVLRGHHAQSLIDLVAALHPIRPTLVVNARAERSLLPGDLEVHRLFNRTTYEEPGIGRRPEAGFHRRWWKLRRGARRIETPLRRQVVRVLKLLPDRVQAGAVGAHLEWLELFKWPELAHVSAQARPREAHHVVLPTAEPDLLLELCRLLRRHASPYYPVVHARFMAIHDKKGGLKRIDRLFRELAASPELACRLHLYVEMPAAQRFLRDRYRVPVDLYPYLLRPPLRAEPRQPRPRGAPVAFGLLGAARVEKGFDRLLPIIRLVTADPAFDPRRLAFIVQVDGRDAEIARWRTALDTVISDFDVNVEVHEGSLGPDQYAALLDRVDCLLLPYVSDRYRLSGSGLATEALLDGKPFISSKGLSFADYARGGNAVEAADDAGFARAILEISQEPDAFFAAARRCATQYRQALEENALLRRLREPVRHAQQVA